MTNLQDFKNTLITDLTNEGLTPYYAVAVANTLTEYFNENGDINNQLRTLQGRIRTIRKAVKKFENRF